MKVDYSTITELPESKVLPIQVDRSYSRYKFATAFCEGKEVLEVACGGGQGLGLLAATAKKVVGGDYEQNNLAHARTTYQKRPEIEVTHLDAHHLGFPDQSFDVILLYEAIYYLKDVEAFFRGAHRVLRPGGTLIICTTNKDWPDFNPSPMSHRYFSIPELDDLCHRHWFQSEMYGAFPDDTSSGQAKLRSLIKRCAVKCHLMPKTMKGKVLLKRLFFGGLVTMPREFKEGDGKYTSPVNLSSKLVDSVHTAIYVVARKIGQ
ncbi:MAG: class I SAM-dependent methyltransferase [Deltaproteobacteria bacterium]|nr:class I SAM-dependent methyltransferase [Deltaproteobacteria bacterium]